ncbi:hypothetical protein METBIDRAFT_35582 [Metschnikowia bicuspidata var. bicuspidata NRRL YB-4993]|uniref:COX assembly mitochondrial protein n=1 Tax=Metschnikowia bicuspidata var. bicuspidata NRRL YB-4993 TaxID=869754 RepID=A0A1A0HGK2_9ASCO|nr:hypothetical protein METBIDRAFT_35582 [Metschnikowia bicuspidata var. bicuspidata NRRL YB-4993]OBA23131.1 hypothetical protein METBIDRAFT_35582 [Metschnikowia bicuspidata var. bicuspidata NRRL YB-4993]
MSKQPYDNRDLPTNPNLPVWVLTPKEEQVCFERWRKKTFERCDDLIKAYVACSNSYESPIEAMAKCEGINKAQLGCVAKYQTMEYLDQERDILIADKKIKQKIYRERLAAARAEASKTGADAA